MTDSATEPHSTADVPSDAFVGRHARRTDTAHMTGDRRRARGWMEQPRSTVLAYAAAFVLAEALGAWVDPALAVLVHGVMTVVALNQAIFGYRNRRTAGLVMGTLYSSRLLTYTLPLLGVSTPTRTALVGALNIAAVMLATWVLRHDVPSGRSTEGFALKSSRWSRAGITVAVAVLGLPLGWAAYHLATPAPLLLKPLAGDTLLPTLFACGALVLGAISEELLYRFLVAAMVQHTALSQTPWVSAALFGATYFGTHNAGLIGLTFATGAIFAWSCERTGSVRGPVIGHAIISVVAFVILP